MKKLPDVFDIGTSLLLLERHGLEVDCVETWLKKFRNLRGAANQRGVTCELTLSQYIALAIRAGITSPDQIGIKPRQYCMGRKGDSGNYAKGNCRFITNKRNAAERVSNGGAASQAKKLRGRTKLNDFSRAAQAEKLSRPFSVVSPSGKKFKGKNMTAFANEHGLNPGNFNRLCNGKIASHKGWTAHK